MASVTSAIPEVRKKLLEIQQRSCKDTECNHGRKNIGTCVLPHADVKRYI